MQVFFKLVFNGLNVDGGFVFHFFFLFLEFLYLWKFLLLFYGGQALGGIVYDAPLHIIHGKAKRLHLLAGGMATFATAAIYVIGVLLL